VVLKNDENLLHVFDKFEAFFRRKLSELEKKDVDKSLIKLFEERKHDIS